MREKSNLRLVKPSTEKRAVAPRRQPNRELRSREHLTEAEVEKLIKAAKDVTILIRERTRWTFHNE